MKEVNESIHKKVHNMNDNGDTYATSSYKALRIEDLPSDIKPREILKRVGPRHSSDDTLLSVILRVGVSGANVVETAKRLLVAFGSLSELSHASCEEIVAKKIPGIGETKALQIIAAIEFGRRCSYSELLKTQDQSEKYISSSEDVYNLLMPTVFELRQEVFYVILLGPRNKLIGVPHEIAKGQRDEVALQPNLVFEPAIRESAKCVIVAHNHPSGDPTPSDLDIELTRNLVNAGTLMHIPVIDHVIIGVPTDAHSGFFSIAAAELVKF